MDRLFDNEWILRALALILAVVLWVQASLYFISIDSVTVGRVALHVVGVPPGYTATTTVRQVEVTVLAPSTLPRLGPEAFTATVTPAMPLVGTVRLPVRVAVPRGTRLKAVSPAVVPVRLVRNLPRAFRGRAGVARG
ncbi:MAG: hypothetical protein K6V73_03705 [Firmicutes bacterium]|nr:hypothetical protein [Bacillota bacterium]